VHAEYVPESRSGDEGSHIKVKGTIHWVSTPHAIKAEVRLYDRLFRSETPGDDFKLDINPDSLKVISQAYVEPGLALADPASKFQFIRKGYFVLDKPGQLVFNQTVTLKDTWAKEVRKENP